MHFTSVLLYCCSVLGVFLLLLQQMINKNSMTHLNANSHICNILYITGTFDWLIDASIFPTVCSWLGWFFMPSSHQSSHFFWFNRFFLNTFLDSRETHENLQKQHCHWRQYDGVCHAAANVKQGSVKNGIYFAHLYYRLCFKTVMCCFTWL